jgi:hypothetical protein
MHLDEFSSRLGAAIDVPAATLTHRARRLRTAKLFSKGVQGRGAHVNNRDAAHLLLAGLIEHEYGADLATEVERIRALPFAEFIGFPQGGFADCLTFTRAGTLGAALVGLLDDLRSGAFTRFEQENPRPLELTLSLDAANGEGFIMLDRKGDALVGHGLWFYRAGEVKRRAVWRQTHVDRELFHELAATLGPPS